MSIILATSDTIDFSALKKKPSHSSHKHLPDRGPPCPPQACQTPSVPSNDQSYFSMLDRVFQLFQRDNPDYQTASKVVVIPRPKVVQISKKKTAWTNFLLICDHMGWDCDHVYKFISAELATDGNLSGNNQLILRGKFTEKGIETLLDKYTREYVVCRACGSWETHLVKYSGSRELTQECQKCKNSFTVANVSSGYRAKFHRSN